VPRDALGTAAVVLLIAGLTRAGGRQVVSVPGGWPSRWRWPRSACRQ